MNPVLGMCGRQRQGTQDLVRGSLALPNLLREPRCSMVPMSLHLQQPPGQAPQPRWLSISLLLLSLLSAYHYPSTWLGRPKEFYDGPHGLWTPGGVPMIILHYMAKGILQM